VASHPSGTDAPKRNARRVTCAVRPLSNELGSLFWWGFLDFSGAGKPLLAYLWLIMSTLY